MYNFNKNSYVSIKGLSNRFVEEEDYCKMKCQKKTCNQNIATFNYFQAKFHFHFSLLLPVVVILSTRLAVILKFPYLCHYGLSITKEFN